ncbi:PcfJ domain-containing protein [Oceanimonas sp. AH20CE76]|uniref:PcfJ domain-containing protein n=1 Tax=Oceanimonas TaxID=129577 RepID=UPI0031FF3299
MWLDPQHMEMTASGHFEIRLEQPFAIHFRYSCWRSGLVCERREQGRWVTDAHTDYGMALLDIARLAGEQSVPGRFAGQIPVFVRRAVQPYFYQQTRLLQWLAREPAAGELFAHSPHLLWLLVAHSELEGWPAIQVSALLSAPRRNVVQALGGEGSKALLKLLGRVQLVRGDLKECRLLLQLCREQTPMMLRVLAQQPALTIYHVLFAVRFPELLQSRFMLLNEVSRFSSCDALTARLKSISRIWQDVLRLAEALNIPDAGRALNRCADMDALNRLHDRWTDRLNRQHCLAAHGSMYFPAPPLPGNEHIIPIETLEDLQAEGRLMRHCVASYVNRIMAGECYIYRIMQPQRATFELGYSQGQLTVMQVQLQRNHRASNETHQAIHDWLRRENDKQRNYANIQTG